MPGDEPDACLGWIPGVFLACCGHGYTPRAYVDIGLDGEHPHVILREEKALAFFDLLKAGELVIPGAGDDGDRAPRTGCPTATATQRAEATLRAWASP